MQHKILKIVAPASTSPSRNFIYNLFHADNPKLGPQSQLGTHVDTSKAELRKGISLWGLTVRAPAVSEKEWCAAQTA